MSNDQFAGFQLLTPRSEEAQPINLLVYGDSDCGKTRFLGTASLVERFSPVLHLDVEMGRETLDELPGDAKIDIIPIKRWTQIQQIYNDLYEGTHPYKSVSLDNGTYAQALGMYKLIGVEDYVFDTSRLAEFKDFNGNTEQMKRMVRAFRDLDMNFFMSAHADIAEDPKTKLNKNFPMFTGKLMRQMPGMFSQVFYLYKDEGKNKATQRVMQTVGTATTTAKCRKIVLDEIIITPHMQMLADAPIKEND